MDRFSEKDWKLFRSKIAGWQEAYMDRLNEEYMEILSGEGAASEKFWKLEKRIKEKFAGCPEKCKIVNTDIRGFAVPSWLDRKWYIEQAKKEINKFYGKD